MPILTKEPDIYPADLLERPQIGAEGDCHWWALYTLSRREKDLMRRLLALELPFYCPIVPHHYRSPSGRKRVSYLPLFANYVFLYGDGEARYAALTTNCIARDLEVGDGVSLTHDLRQIKELNARGVPLTREAQLQPGQRVRIKSGRFRGYEGVLIRRESETRLLIAVNFLQQGASFLLEDFEVEPI
jgi:transcription antitermination factor NusG